MANIDNANGFTPSRHLKGGVIRVSEKLIASGYNTNIFSGDVVKLLTTGMIALAAPGDTNIIGVFAGVEWTAADGEAKFGRYWPASTATRGAAAAKAMVYDDPEIAFGVQTGGVTAFAQDMVGANCDTLAEHPGNVATGQSAMELDITAPATTTANCRVIGIIPRTDNALGASADVEIMFVEHLNRPAGTVGI